MLAHVGELAESGVYSFKIEGRMKSPYYVASVVNAYRKAIDMCYEHGSDVKLPEQLFAELYKNSHRDYTTGFYFKDKDNVCLETSQPKCDYEFMAQVIGYREDIGMLEVEMRNRFKAGDELEILSPGKHWNEKIKIEKMYDVDMAPIEDAKIVQQRIFIPTSKRLEYLDILRKKTNAALK